MDNLEPAKSELDMSRQIEDIGKGEMIQKMKHCKVNSEIQRCFSKRVTR